MVTTRHSDDELVQRTLGGQLSAFEILVERHRDVVFRVAARMVGTKDAEDVAQDAFLRAFHRLGRFRGEAPFRSWLLRITHNAALDTIARRRPTHDELEPGAVASELPSRRRTPAEELEAASAASGSRASCASSSRRTGPFSSSAIWRGSATRRSRR